MSYYPLISIMPKAAPYSYLLDDYSGAAAAYSLRKLRSAYTGNAIRVRRASDNTEQDIGFVNNVLDTAAISSFVGGGQGYVTTWYDQSGNGINVTQSTATSQPMIMVAGGLVTRGGKPAVSFRDPFGNLNNSLQNAATGFPVNNVSHFAVSSKRTNGADLRTLYSTGILAAADGFGLFYNTDEKLYYQARAGATINVNSGYTNVNNTNNLIFGVLTSSVDNHWYNGGTNQSVSHSRPNANSTGALTLGANSNPFWHHNGTISEIVFWNANQTTNRTGIESNINSFYSVFSSAPTWNGTQTGLLNTYPGAAAAYSVRALNSAYTGPLIRVRRSSDNNEIDIFALQNGQLDTTFLLAFCGAGNGFVTTWYDQSGNGNNLTQTTATLQPRIVVSGALILQNGKPSISDLVNNNIKLSVTLNGSANFYAFNVMKYLSGTNVLYSGQTADRWFFAAFTGDTSNIFSNNAGTPTFRKNGVLQSYANRGAAATSLANQSLFTVTADTGTTGWTELTLGYQNTVSMFNMQEVVIYYANKDSDRTGIESNINTYYTIY